MRTADADNWRQRTALVGSDWAGDHHDVVLVDFCGKIGEGAAALLHILKIPARKASTETA